MNESDASEALDRAAAALPAAIDPERDLWPAIEACIVSKPASRPTPRAWPHPGWAGQLAAAVTLMAVASIATFMLVDRPQAPAQPDEQALAWADIWAEPARFGARDALSQEYLDARHALTTTLEQRLGALSPDTRALVVANLIEIRQALDAINVALAEDPDNALLQRLLLKTYQDEMYVLVNLNSTTQPIRERIEL
ncbi:MAG: hypothetical protein H0W33_08105 [Gammaproteobacteria bacterium]|nr:hypothetical protein [Gammaproteobacteria bacterium]